MMSAYYDDYDYNYQEQHRRVAHKQPRSQRQRQQQQTPSWAKELGLVGVLIFITFFMFNYFTEKVIEKAPDVVANIVPDKIIVAAARSAVSYSLLSFFGLATLFFTFINIAQRSVRRLLNQPRWRTFIDKALLSLSVLSLLGFVYNVAVLPKSNVQNMAGVIALVLAGLVYQSMIYLP